jgi:geranylgeranyl pyrophosphate synthase
MDQSLIASWAQQELQRIPERYSYWVTSDVSFIQDYIEYTMSKPGKLLRPLVVILCAGDSFPDRKKVIDLALAVELIHIASLIHDDVIDHSDFRRGIETLQKKWGRTSSVLFGDFLLSRAFVILASLRSMKIIDIISQATSYICQGELMQNHWRYKYTLAESEYLKIVEYKTARLIAAACHAGAVLGERDDSFQNMLAEIGTTIGIAFQLYDDCLDFVGSAEVMGKPSFNDLTNGFATLPVIYLLNRENGNVRAEIIEQLGQIEKPETQNIIHQKLKQHGSIDQALELAGIYTSRAHDLLKQLPDTELQTNLYDIANYIIARNK